MRLSIRPLPSLFPVRLWTDVCRLRLPRLRAVPALAFLFLGLNVTTAKLAAAAPEDAERAKLEFFEKEVRPVLATYCFECHGEKKQKSGLRLDALAHILEGGESGPALVRGKPEDSLLIEAVRYTNEDLQMPPKEQLGTHEVEVLEKWIALGAPWPAESATKAVSKAPKDAHGFTAEDRAYWVFQPVAATKPPALRDAAAKKWAGNEIDHFIAAKHTEHGLEPAPAADRRELVRRVYFDVHGLPPTQGQIEAFVHDSTPNAYPHLVDTLLASPRYGERWAQHWLDLVRYAESDGYRADAYRPGAWPYRDYVIKSFNADKPYDRFVREQLAGDEIAPNDPEVLIATSYLRNPIYEWNQRDVRGQAELILTDLTDNAGEVFLGLSMGCARCHDHKFDPILQKDYFSLRAFFEPVLWRTDLKLATADEQSQHAEKLKAWEAATVDIRKEMDALTQPELEKLVKRAYDRFTDDIRAMMDKPADQREPHEHILASIANRQLEYEYERFDPAKAVKSAEGKARYRELETALKRFDHLKPVPLLEALVATDAGKTAPPTRMKSRKGEQEIGPAFLSLLEPQAPQIEPLAHSTGRRTALANWITRPDNPLSTRVIVNRVWQHHFGRGLAGVPNDLGRLGERPTHPELLDWLTQRFVAGGWSLKSLHRDILLSATYQQTARHTSEKAALVDPENKYLWRYSPRRLDAEQARDAILAATGELDLKLGGPSEEGTTSSRRSIYTIKKRNNPNELLRSFDAPAGFSSIADRQRTSTPLQALLMMNGDWTLARARQLATVAPNIDAAWQATLGRSPEAPERELAESFIQRRIASATPLPDASGKRTLVATDTGVFHENTPQERLIARVAPREGDDFTVEAMVTVESIDAGGSVRTIASRWNGEKSSLEAHGWSLGVTGTKSAFKPRNVILQLVGEDDNMNTTYEVVASGLHLELQRPYQIVATVSCTDHTVKFTVRDLNQPEAAPRTATVKHGVVGKIGTGQAQPVMGGLARRTPHQFDGLISAVRIYSGAPAMEAMAADPKAWSGHGLIWRASDPLAQAFSWSGGTNNAESRDPQVRALADLGHVLLNANEFIYLH